MPVYLVTKSGKVVTYEDGDKIEYGGSAHATTIFLVKNKQSETIALLPADSVGRLQLEMPVETGGKA
jgi:phage baseplate assembly protein gpV